ncbi:MAG TPA: NAD(P)-dependent oxidoreductase [Verrucomicrobiae bacterium]|nr:NAD(P)-dependent oxidoreductase [Verrucomicrobiae bacterium]
MPKPIGPIRPIGLIALGLMGSAIAERLLAARHSVLGWDISPAARTRHSRLGGIVASNAGEVFTRCNCILLSLPDSKITRAVLRDAANFLHQGHIIADTTTGSPSDAIDLSRQLARKAVRYLGATISGNSDQVRRGEVLVMVGGPVAAYRRCKKLFATFAAHTIHTGSAGSAAQMKLVTNLVLGLNRAALAEGLVFARALKLNGEQTLKILRASMAYSRIMDVKGEKMLRGDFKPQARLAQHLKDVRLMLAAARKAHTKLPLTETHRGILATAEAAGLGHLDNSAIIRVIGPIRPIRPLGHRK